MSSNIKIGQKLNQRLESIDGLRGIAAFLVVIGHYFTAFYGFNKVKLDLLTYKSYQILFPFSDIGFSLFFIISGFLIFATIEKNSAKKFVVNRFSRLFPTYWLCVVLTTIVIYFLDENRNSIVQFFGNLTMFQRFLGIKHIDGVYWTLEVELIFYFSVLLIKSISSSSKITISFLFIILFSILSHLFFKSGFISNISNIITTNQNSGILILLSKELKHFAVFFDSYLPFFFIGIIIHELRQKRISNYFFYFCLIIVFWLIYLEHTRTLFIVSFGNIALFVLALCKYNKFFTTKIFKFLGKVSYPLYLFHQKIGYLVILFLLSFGINLLLAKILMIAIALLIASWISTNIELNFMYKLRKIFK